MFRIALSLLCRLHHCLSSPSVVMPQTFTCPFLGVSSKPQRQNHSFPNTHTHTQEELERFSVLAVWLFIVMRTNYNYKTRIKLPLAREFAAPYLKPPKGRKNRQHRKDSDNKLRKRDCGESFSSIPFAVPFAIPWIPCPGPCPESPFLLSSAPMRVDWQG